jgi:hypothetical protein
VVGRVPLYRNGSVNARPPASHVIAVNEGPRVV